ncbi:F-type H+-transporting ATPase subunit b [Alphaproteobacteria bacterium]
MFFSEIFWVTLSFFILLFSVYKPAKKMIIATLDGRISKIQDEIKEASTLKEEAYQRLIVLKEGYTEALGNNALLMSQAKLEAESILEEAKARVVEIAKKGEDLIREHQIQQERDIINKIKQDVMVSVLSAVEEILLKNLSYSDQVNILESDRRIFKKFWH